MIDYNLPNDIGLVLEGGGFRGMAPRQWATIDNGKNAPHTLFGLGNFWVDLTRSVVYILLPLSIVFALVLVGQGVVQTFSSYTDTTTLEGVKQVIPLGPAASQIAIKQLGTNGGGFFGVNSAHPFENPTPFSNFLEMLALLLIPAALTYTYGLFIGSKKQGWTLFGAMCRVPTKPSKALFMSHSIRLTTIPSITAICY